MLEEKPLNGIRVLDLTRVLGGPFCTMNLADLGAEVIKLELPGEGDESRRAGPRLPGTGDSGYFYTVNRGKQSVTLDVRTAEGAQIFLELVKRSDVVAENFRPGTMERFKLGYERLSAINPKIILCSISGFGQVGPLSQAPAYDIVVQALGGMMSITGEPGEPPLRCGVSVADLTVGLYGAMAVLAALRVRERTGRGRHLDIAMLDCQVALLEDALSRYSLTKAVPSRIGARHATLTPFERFRASDDYFVTGAGNEAVWRRMCDAIGLPELKSDPRFLTNDDRTAHESELKEILAERFLAEPRAHWLEKLGKARVPCAPIANVEEVARNHHLHERRMILQADHPFTGEFIVPGSPLKSVGSDAEPDTRAPGLGEHTDKVLSRLLGYDAKRLADLRANGII
jgi:CoA:oxalate CoA-transferase